jgi:hypothetical protein
MAAKENMTGARADRNVCAALVRWLLGVVVMCAGFVGCPATLLAATAAADSPSFTLDTVSASTSVGGKGAADSAGFTLDTRPYLGPFFAMPFADSGMFTLDTRGGAVELRAMEVSPEGKVRFEFLGFPGYQYTVQVSTNLVHWQVLDSVLATNGMASFSEIWAPGFSARFYRVIVE